MSVISKDAHDMIHLAKVDYISAKKLDDPDSYSTCKYHQQQCVEKLLKAYLIENKVVPKKTHILEDLYEECKPFGLVLKKETEIQLSILTNFEVETRYIRAIKPYEEEKDEVAIGWECVSSVEKSIIKSLNINEYFDNK